MAIAGLKRGNFEEIIDNYLSPSRPIRKTEFLMGRVADLEVISRALKSSGRQVFIYGDRGVGKTSLGLTASNSYAQQFTNLTPITLSCSSGTNFSSLITEAITSLHGHDPRLQKRAEKSGLFASMGNWFGARAERTDTINTRPEIHDVNDAISHMAHAVKDRLDAPILFIDEFDRLEDEKDRRLFGDFVKQIGDRDIGLKLVICGIGDSLQDLLSAHESAYRYIEGINLEPLIWQTRQDIMMSAADALNLDIDIATRYRICVISDGFPHFIHLVCQKIFWRTFEDKKICDQPTVKHYNQGIAEAVKGAEPHLISVYEKATRKYNDDYEVVLWAAADHRNPSAPLGQIYESYKRLMGDLDREPLSRSVFSSRMHQLKSRAHGEILVGSRQGWYEFREKFVRGYVRLRAEENGVQLERDHAFPE